RQQSTSIAERVLPAVIARAWSESPGGSVRGPGPGGFRRLGSRDLAVGVLLDDSRSRLRGDRVSGGLDGGGVRALAVGEQGRSVVPQLVDGLEDVGECAVSTGLGR